MTEAQLATAIGGGLVGFGSIGFAMFKAFTALKQMGVFDAHADATKDAFTHLHEEMDRMSARIKDAEDRDVVTQAKLEVMTKAAIDTDRHVMLLEMILDILAAKYGIDIDAEYAKYGITRRYNKKP
jgi:glyceraldehyde-3-phosphate dehydrogenase/erythrose-4-phosphate dehydrogenase